MPYSGPGDEKLPSNVKSMPKKLQSTWVRTWNSVFNKTKSEAQAFKIANSVCDKMRKDMSGDDIDNEPEDSILEELMASEIEANEKPSRDFLMKLREFFRGMKGQTIDDAMIDKALKSSAGYAGGVRHRKTASETDFFDLCADLFCEECGSYEQQENRFFQEFKFSAAPQMINVLPLPGTYKHPSYGDIKISRERNARFVTNFNQRVYQEKIPIDSEHETKMSGALGWIVRLVQNSDGSVDAEVNWEDRGRQAIEEGRFKYFSPEWYDQWRDPIGGKVYQDVLIGGALTTRPFFKEAALKPMVASEMAYQPATQKEANVENNASEESKVEVTKEQFEALQNQFTELKTARETDQSALEELKSAREADQAALTQEKERREAAEARVASLESAARRERFAQITREPHVWFGDRAKHIARLEKLAEAFGEDSDDFKEYVADQTAAAEQLAKSELFSEKGSQQTPQTATGIDDKVKAYMEAHPDVEEAEAVDAVLQAEPQLYNEYVRSQRKAVATRYN